MPVQTARLKDTVEVGIVTANVPLLISKTKLKEWGGVIDFVESILFLKATGDTIQLTESESGHLTLNVAKSIDNDGDEMMREIFMITKKKDYKMKELKKIHRIFGHPCQD